MQPLALRLLAGDFHDGDTIVVVDDGDGQFVFRSGETSASVEGDGTGRKGAVGSTGAAAGASSVPRARRATGPVPATERRGGQQTAASAS